MSQLKMLHKRAYVNSKIVKMLNHLNGNELQNNFCKGKKIALTVYVYFN